MMEFLGQKRKEKFEFLNGKVKNVKSEGIVDSYEDIKWCTKCGHGSAYSHA